MLTKVLRIGTQLFSDLVSPGEVIGATLAHVTPAVGASARLDVVTVGSHDTASAVVAVPMDASLSAYISCGTWGLVGVELESPVLSEASRAANFTTEMGVDGRISFFHRVIRVVIDLSGRSVLRVRMVGGGAMNAVLCQLTVDRVGMSVIAGPVEATAIGNVLVQARAAGLVDGDLDGP